MWQSMVCYNSGMRNEYYRTYMQNRRLQRRTMLLELSGNKCSACNSGENLEFNHIDRATKLFVLSGKGLDKKLDDILLEHQKCELLCSECHLDKTRHQYATKQIKVWNDRKDEPYLHGTARNYHEKACRCDDCKYAKKLYREKQIDLWTQVHSNPR